MANFDSRSAYFSINDGADRDLTAYLTDVTGLPGPTGLKDATTLGDSATKDFAGIPDSTFTLTLLYDDTATTGPEAVIVALWSSKANATFRYGPKGSTAAFLKYSGTIKIADMDLSAKAGDQQKMVVQFKLQTVVTRGTF